MEINRITATEVFDDWFYGVPTRGKYHERGQIRGLPPAYFGCYINREFKTNPIKEHIKELEQTDAVCQYVGLAIDEMQRSKSKAYTDGSYSNSTFRFPLIEWGWRERETAHNISTRLVCHTR